jgi:lysyl endopeptidase
MKVLPLIAAFLVVVTVIHGQISYGGQPQDWDRKDLQLNAFLAMPAIDRIALAAEDAVTDRYKEAPYRFGVEHNVSLTPENSGEWRFDETTNQRIWQVGIHCADATSISFFFDQFAPAEGVKVYIWDAQRTHFLGAFDWRNRHSSNVLATSLVYTDKAVIELHVPPALQEYGTIRIGQVVHGYRNVINPEAAFFSAERGPFGSSGACNINVNCPEGAAWQQQKRSVALMVSGGSAFCTGALVNNTAQDGTPYFLTANHCLGGSTNSYVFYFNHESASCTGSTGPVNQTVSGSQLRASRAGSDFALLELNDVPPVSYDVHYAGWDHSDSEAAVSSTVGIHHPSGDVKKICFDNDSPYHDTQAGAQVWFIDEWEDGVTEGGSSGSPLFDQQQRIIGQLYGGLAACSGVVNNGQYDYYGRFGVSWDAGTSQSQRLREWLDPSNLGVVVLNGSGSNFTSYTNDAAITDIMNVDASLCGSTIQPIVRITNGGSAALTACTIQYQLSNGPAQTYNWTGSLGQFESTMITLPTLNVANGNNTLTFSILSANNAADENGGNNVQSVSFVAVTGPTVEATLILEFDAYPEETSWEVTNGNGQVVQSGGTYDGASGTLELPVCLAPGCYTLTMLDSYGDGMCCGLFTGFGSYSFLSENGQELAAGGEFDSEESTLVCVGGVGVAQPEMQGFRSYPNPAVDQLWIETIEVIREVRLYESTGRLALTKSIGGANLLSLPVANLAPGIYVLWVKTDHGIHRTAVVVSR